MDDQKRIDSCYAIENKPEALECLKNVVRTAESECRPKLILLTEENCIPCKEERARHKKALEEGVLREVSIDTPEGFDIATRNGIESVPSLILLDCKDKLILPSSV